MEFVGQSATKINRAMRLADAGRYPRTFDGLLAHVPAELRASLTGAQLAQVIDALEHCARASKALRTREIREDGGIWNETRGRFDAIGA